ncbi:hypothetical protein [Devosia sp. 2618]|uniref:hypothetical protein n=1 Tax=Devosia sp. 2618 TaxID=3156454 RepID=UPI0033953674
MFASILQSALAGWLWRRCQELAGVGGVLVPIYLNMSPANQAAVQEILQGRGGGLSITAAFGLAVYLYSQVKSLRATIQPQVVTTDGTKIALPKSGTGVSTTRKVEALAEAAPVPRTLWDRITGK